MKRTLGEHIAQARREMGVRQWRDVRRSELAEAAGVDPSAITLYEKGKSNPSEDVIVRLAKFFGVTPAYLRYRVTEMAESSKSVITAAQPSMTVTGREKKRRPGEA